MKTKTITTLLLLGSVALAAPQVAVRADQPGTMATGTDPDREAHGGPLPLAAASQIYVMTDKPLYRPGETIWFRAWEIDGSMNGTNAAGMTVQLVDPRGGVAVEKRVRSVAGSAHNDIALATSLAGGRYLLRVRSDSGIVEERPLTISTYEIPRLKQQLEFGKRGYAPGDEVIATLTVRRATGEAARGARVSGTVNVDGLTVAQPSSIVGKTGEVILRFRLPANIGKGDGLLTAVVTDGGASESIQRRIPIETGNVALAFYPEGGDLVAGLASRVYFSATSALGESVDIKGTIVDDLGARVGTFSTTFRGKGTFSFTPAAGRTYRATIDRKGAQPAVLPQARDSGCVLGVHAAAATKSADLEATVTCSSEQPIELVAALRGREVGRATGKAGPTATTLRVPLQAAGQGALRLTLTAGNAPIAERLVYRKLGSDVTVTLTPEQSTASPREMVSILVETRGPDGRPVAADLAVAAVDDAVLALADDRSARIMASLYLEPEMPGQQIDDPNFYFSSDPKAPAALDLVLGTQGWRRFKRVAVK